MPKVLLLMHEPSTNFQVVTQSAGCSNEDAYMHSCDPAFSLLVSSLLVLTCSCSKTHDKECVMRVTQHDDESIPIETACLHVPCIVRDQE